MIIFLLFAGLFPEPMLAGQSFCVFCATIQKDDSCQSFPDKFFSPPARLADRYGVYRSPLQFYSGRKVKTHADWTLRRREILVPEGKGLKPAVLTVFYEPETAISAGKKWYETSHKHE